LIRSKVFEFMLRSKRVRAYSMSQNMWVDMGGVLRPA
jgi:hypothetical protein